MAFYGRNFTFDGISSEIHNLTISSTDGESSTSGTNVQLITEKLYRRPKEFLYGVQDPNLTQNQKNQKMIELHALRNAHVEAIDKQIESRMLNTNMIHNWRITIDGPTLSDVRDTNIHNILNDDSKRHPIKIEFMFQQSKGLDIEISKVSTKLERLLFIEKLSYNFISLLFISILYIFFFR